jgi:hypothetical protein
LNNLPAMRPGPREAGKQSGRSFATATLCFYKPRQGVLFDPVAKDLKGPTLIQTLCYAFGRNGDSSDSLTFSRIS